MPNSVEPARVTVIQRVNIIFGIAAFGAVTGAVAGRLAALVVGGGIVGFVVATVLLRLRARATSNVRTGRRLAIVSAE
jgi:hypothetical protein